MKLFSIRKLLAMQSASIALVMGVVMWQTPVAQAGPFTDKFDALIAELQSRAAILSNSTDKAEQAQFKAIVKVLNTLIVKDATSEATDIKNLGKIAKALLKAFPNEFTTTLAVPSGLGAVASNLEILLDAALTGFINDGQADLDDLAAALAGLPASTCKDKALALLDSIQTQLDAAGATADFVAAAKALGQGFKGVDKGAVLADKAANCGGGPPVDIVDMTAKVNGTNFDGSSVSGHYNPTNDQITVTGIQGIAESVITLILHGVTTNGTYNLESGTNFRILFPTTTVFGGNLTGTVTFTKVDILNEDLSGSFHFSATQSAPAPSAAQVEVTQGQFVVKSFVDPPNF